MSHSTLVIAWTSIISLNNGGEYYKLIGSVGKAAKDNTIMDPSPQQLGKYLLIAGAVIALLGVLLMVLGRIGLFRLPGDLEFGSKNWRVYFPIASCILISILLTLVFWLINFFRR